MSILGYRTHRKNPPGRTTGCIVGTQFVRHGLGEAAEHILHVWRETHARLLRKLGYKTK
jgi:hypothetical protein